MNIKLKRVSEIENTPHKQYCPSVVVGMCIFWWIFRAINGRRKKATRDRECQLRKSKSLARLPPERLFSVAFFSSGSAQVLLVQHIHCFQSKMYTKSQSTWTRQLLVSCKVPQSSTWFQSSISQLHLIHHSTSVLHLTAPFDRSTSVHYFRRSTRY